MHFPQILSTCDHVQSNIPPGSNLYNLSAATGSFLAFNVSPHDQSSQRNAKFQQGFIEYILFQNTVCLCVRFGIIIIIINNNNNNIRYYNVQSYHPIIERKYLIIHLEHPMELSNPSFLTSQHHPILSCTNPLFPFPLKKPTSFMVCWKDPATVRASSTSCKASGATVPLSLHLMTHGHHP